MWSHRPLVRRELVAVSMYSASRGHCMFTTNLQHLTVTQKTEVRTAWKNIEVEDRICCFFLLRMGKKAQMMEECGEKQPRDSGKLTKKKSSGLKERKAAAK